MEADVMNVAEREDVILRYVVEHFAYFTPRALSEQWGDDWNDRPYEHNAGTPYDSDIVMVAWRANFDLPCAGMLNSGYSVEDINRARKIPWLRPDPYCPPDARAIWAGTTLREFIRLIHLGGGQIWLPYEPPAGVPTSAKGAST